MKHNTIAFFLCILAALAFSCKKHVVEYDVTPVNGQAEFQLHYFVPVTTGAANNITKVELNGVWINATAPLTTYNAIPGGTVGKFYATKTGSNNIKLYKGDNMDLVYDQNVNLTAGKQNIFIYDFAKPPIVFDNGYPYTADVTENTGTASWIKFYNFLYESPGVPTTLKLQYQYQYTINNETGEKSEWINVGKPIAFGEATGWEKIYVNKTVQNSAGSARQDYKILVINSDGSSAGDLMVLNSSGKTVAYSDYWTASVGRRFHHVLSGFRNATPVSAVRQFTAL